MENDDFLPISGVQHVVFCERQCGLMYVEGVWGDNVLTAEGKVLHERVDSGFIENRPGVRAETSLHLSSERLRLYGIADLVEFRETPGGDVPFPVEYKHGKILDRKADQVQLCAQAIALEEMLGVPVPEGAVYYHASKKRFPVAFVPAIRDLTVRAARRFHEIVERQETPRAEFRPKCRSCSLLDFCLPLATSGKDIAR